MRVSFLLSAALALVWCLIVGEFSTGQLLLGLILGSLFVFVAGAGRGRRVPLRQLPRRFYYIAVYLLLIPYDIVTSNLRMAWRLLRRDPPIRPGIVRMSLGEIGRVGVALEEHALTIAPGQMVVDYAKDGRTIYVHLIDASDLDGTQIARWRKYRETLERILA